MWLLCEVASLCPGQVSREPRQHCRERGRGVENKAWLAWEARGELESYPEAEENQGAWPVKPRD